MMQDLSRRHLLAAAGAAGALTGAPAAFAQSGAIMTKPIPSSKEALPVVGVGTSQVFDFPETDKVKVAERRQVVEALVAGGGKVIDTAPSYGNAQVVLGEVLPPGGLRQKVFLADKVAGGSPQEQMAEFKRSQERMKSRTVDLLQWHNVRDANTDLAPLRELKAQGLCRYIGITTSFDASYPAIEQALRQQKPDFFQVNYSLGDREAEERLLPAAQEVGAAVLTNLPFGRKRMFSMVEGKPLPEWAKEFDAATWGQFFLKYLISHPAVVCVIPGTSQPRHMLDNLGAGRGRMPDAAMRKRMADYWASLPG